MMRELGLFAGIGSFSLGLERSGLCKPVGFVEIDGFCQQILRKHWPSVPCYDNVLTREFVEGEADIITAGFPCQDLSYAGKGAGLAGERSGLWREVVRAVRLVRPAYTILENVAALLGRGLGRVLGDLAEIGHDAEWHCIPASAVGAPHRRDRIWIVANPGGEQHEGGRAPFSGEIAKELHGTPTDAEGIRCGQGGQGRVTALREVRHTAITDTDAAAMLGASELGSKPHGDHERLTEMADAGCAGQSHNQGRATPQRINRDRAIDGSGWRDRGHNHWRTEPDVGRVAHGVPSRVDRLRSLGNSLVPQIPEIIGKAILSSMHGGAR